ncbi:MAG TPA: aminoglycoside 6-adenylyltransferase [Bacillales bacterium]|nr:aminoglycoside 6-adenylyltransferase [Bacillales bacterium]
MSNHVEIYENLIGKVTIWADTRKDIRAAMIIGSRARKDEPADEWSDLDVVIFSSNPEHYLSSEEWIHQFGTVWMTFLEQTAVGGGRERRVLYENAYDVDFSFFPIEGLSKLITQPDVRMTIDRGMRILVDKDHQLKETVSLMSQQQQVEESDFSEQAFNNAVCDFWYHAVWSAKKLMRGEWWTAKSCIDGYMKHLLLTILKWHCQAKKLSDSDTWHEGRFFEKWADKETQMELRKCFSLYEAEHMAVALEETMNLFRKVAKETAGLRGCDYNEKADLKATEWLNNKFVEKGLKA